MEQSSRTTIWSSEKSGLVQNEKHWRNERVYNIDGAAQVPPSSLPLAPLLSLLPCLRVALVFQPVFGNATRPLHAGASTPHRS